MTNGHGCILLHSLLGSFINGLLESANDREQDLVITAEMADMQYAIFRQLDFHKPLTKHAHEPAHIHLSRRHLRSPYWLSPAQPTASMANSGRRVARALSNPLACCI